ncbi:serine/threonine-protein kinase [Bacillus sp. SCS-153A]|uniref:serine/threonine-protein kinase n=1 Tax=Rossellomorea sedimentorum TaxID=3115294 RepID=UPI0039062D41
MHDLQFTKTHQYRFLKTIYQKDDNTSAFFEAFDETEKRRVGIKRVKTERKHLNATKSEANMIYQVSSMTTNIPAVYHTYYDQDSEFFYMVMQYIEGGKTLRDYIKVHKQLRQHIQIMIQLCDILIPLHKKRIQHRDLKPENILVKGRDVYLIDYNLTARVPFKGEGTEYYQAPEQGSYVERIGSDRTDLFSLGVLLYELGTGETPQVGNHYNIPYEGQAWEDFVNPKEINGEIPDKLNEIIKKCMKYNPEERYRDAYELKGELISVLRGGKKHGR